MTKNPTLSGLLEEMVSHRRKKTGIDIDDIPLIEILDAT